MPILMVTDPPYGVNYDPEWRNKNNNYTTKMVGKVKNDDQIDWTEVYSLFSGNVAYIWHSDKFTAQVQNQIENCGFETICRIVWNKQHLVLSRGNYHWKHELCLYVVRKGKKHNWQGARDQTTVWDIRNNNPFGNSSKEELMGHGTQKPVDCMKIPIINNSKRKEKIYDPFLGSGTTLIACEETGRNCLGQEINPIYMDMIIRRYISYMNVAGKKFEIIRNDKVLNRNELSYFIDETGNS